MQLFFTILKPSLSTCLEQICLKHTPFPALIMYWCQNVKIFWHFCGQSTFHYVRAVTIIVVYLSLFFLIQRTFSPFPEMPNALTYDTTSWPTYSTGAGPFTNFAQSASAYNDINPSAGVVDPYPSTGKISNGGKYWRLLSPVLHRVRFLGMLHPQNLHREYNSLTKIQVL